MMSQTITVLNKITGQKITKTFQEWMVSAVRIAKTWNTDFGYLEVVKPEED